MYIYIYIYIFTHAFFLLLFFFFFFFSQGLVESPSQSCDLSGDFSAIRSGFMIGTLLWKGPIQGEEEEHGSPSSNDVSLQLGEEKSMRAATDRRILAAQLEDRLRCQGF